MGFSFDRPAELLEKDKKVIVIFGDNMPYCLCHKVELKPSLLETKCCEQKNCPYYAVTKAIIKLAS